MIVVDASVVVDLLLGAGSDAGDELASRLIRRETLCAPHLLDAEVGQTLRRFDLRKDLRGDQISVLARDLMDLPIQRYPHSGLLIRALELRKNVTVYDGMYLALAEALGCTFLTGDTGLRGVPGCLAKVELVATSAG